MFWPAVERSSGQRRLLQGRFFNTLTEVDINRMVMRWVEAASPEGPPERRGFDGPSGAPGLRYGVGLSHAADDAARLDQKVVVGFGDQKVVGCRVRLHHHGRERGQISHHSRL
jgi:hypothetical protein